MLSCSAWVRCLHAAAASGRVSGQTSHHSSVTATTAVRNLPRGPCPVPVARCTNISRHGGVHEILPRCGEPLGRCKSC